mgnify:FL=1
MKKETIEKWIENAAPHESIVYYTGHLVEERDKIEIRHMGEAFWLAAQENKIELFQKKIKKGDPSTKPVYEYIARKLKDNEKKLKDNEKSNHN